MCGVVGRHGNKGVISNILPRQDMPYLQDESFFVGAPEVLEFSQEIVLSLEF